MSTPTYKPLANPSVNLQELIQDQNNAGATAGKLSGSEPFDVLASKAIFNNNEKASAAAAGAITIAGTSVPLGGSITESAQLDSISSTRGTLLYRGAAGWSPLAPGTAGYLLSTNGAGADPSYVATPTGTLPSQTGKSGTRLTTNGTTASWVYDPNAIALAPAQALSFDGTAGATIANTQVFGTGDFSVAATVSPTAIGAVQAIVGGAANAFALSIDASGYIYARKTGVANLATSSSPLTAGVVSSVGYTRTGTTGTYYINGIAVGTVTDSNDYTVACTQVGSTAGTQFVTGTLRLLGIENRALSAAEVLSVYQSGSWPSSHFNNASNTATYTSNFSAGTDSWGADSSRAVTGNVDSINGSDNWLKTEVTSGPASLYSYTAASFTSNVKKRLRIAVTIFNPAGSGITHFAIRQNDGTVASGSSVVVALAENTEVTTSVELLMSQVSTRLGVAACDSDGTLNAIATGKIFYLKTFTVYPLGLLVAPDWAGYTGGPQVIDVSGNGADTNLPGDGVTGGVVPTLPGATPSPFRYTRTSSGYLIADQLTIPPGCSVEIWAKGNGTFSLGDSSGTPASIVNAQTAPTNLSPIAQAGYVTATRKLYLTLGSATSVTVRVTFKSV